MSSPRSILYSERSRKTCLIFSDQVLSLFLAILVFFWRILTFSSLVFLTLSMDKKFNFEYKFFKHCFWPLNGLFYRPEFEPLPFNLFSLFFLVLFDNKYLNTYFEQCFWLLKRPFFGQCVVDLLRSVTIFQFWPFFYPCFSKKLALLTIFGLGKRLKW